MRGAQLVWAMSIASAGCSILVDTTGLTGGADSAPDRVQPLFPDGGRAIAVDAAIHAQADSGEVSAPSSSGAFCTSLAPAPTLCRDFDDGVAFDDGFTAHTSGGLLGADSAAASSPPNALFAAVTTGNSSAFIKKSFATASSTVRVAFALRMDEVQSVGNGAMIMQLDVGTHSLRLMVAADHTTLEEWHGGAFDQYVFKATARPTKGSSATIDLTLTVSGTPHLSITHDAKATVDTTLPGAWSSANPELSLGLVYLPSAGPWKLRQDNVIVDIH